MKVPQPTGLRAYGMAIKRVFFVCRSLSSTRIDQYKNRIRWARFAVHSLRCLPDIAHCVDRSFMNREVKPLIAEAPDLGSTMCYWSCQSMLMKVPQPTGLRAYGMPIKRVGRCQFNIRLSSIKWNLIDCTRVQSWRCRNQLDCGFQGVILGLFLFVDIYPLVPWPTVYRRLQESEWKRVGRYQFNIRLSSIKWNLIDCTRVQSWRCRNQLDCGFQGVILGLFLFVEIYPLVD